MNEQEQNDLETVVDAVQAALDRNHYRKAGELIRAYAASLATAQRERDAGIAESVAQAEDLGMRVGDLGKEFGRTVIETANQIAAAIRAQS